MLQPRAVFRAFVAQRCGSWAMPRPVSGHRFPAHAWGLAGDIAPGRWAAGAWSCLPYQGPLSSTLRRTGSQDRQLSVKARQDVFTVRSWGEGGGEGSSSAGEPSAWRRIGRHRRAEGRGERRGQKGTGTQRAEAAELEPRRPGRQSRSAAPWRLPSHAGAPAQSGSEAARWRGIMGAWRQEEARARHPTGHGQGFSGGKWLGRTGTVAVGPLCI